jgi:Mrp family chromosome partitioning ATPase
MLDNRSKLLDLSRSEEADDQKAAAAKPSFGLGSLRSRKGLLASCTLAFLVIGLVYIAFRPATYTASSQLLVYIRQIQSGADLAILPGRADLPLVQNQIELLRSGNVLTKVIDALDLGNDRDFAEDRTSLWSSKAASDPGQSARAAVGAALETLRRKLKVVQIGTSHMITVTYRASDPAKATRIVNTVVRIYLQELARAADAGSSRAPALRELYQSLGPSAFLVSEAQPPIRPDGPPPALIVLIAALLGLGVGAALAFLRDLRNDTLRGAREVEYALGMECLGIISRQPLAGAVTDEAAEQGPYPLELRQLRRLSAGVLEASLRDGRIIGVTSAVPGEGATTVAVGLARSVAALGKRVLLIDSSEDRCVSRWAANATPVPVWSRNGARSNVLEAQPGLHVWPRLESSDGSGLPRRPALPDEILHGSPGSYDLVIVDMPALVAGPEVRAAAPSVDGFLLVVKWGTTESELIRQALRTSGEARPKFVGAILNMADDKKMKFYAHEVSSDDMIAAQA